VKDGRRKPDVNIVVGIWSKKVLKSKSLLCPFAGKSSWKVGRKSPLHRSCRGQLKNKKKKGRTRGIVQRARLGGKDACRLCPIAKGPSRPRGARGAIKVTEKKNRGWTFLPYWKEIGGKKVTTLYYLGEKEE